MATTSHKSLNGLGDDSQSQTVDNTGYTTSLLAPDFSSPTFESATIVAAAAKTASTTLTQTLYLTETGDTSAINVNDIHQGQIGDCFLLSSIGELALNNPSFISQMIKTNSNGTESVTLYTNTKGGIATFNTTAFKSSSQSVTNTFQSNAVNNGSTQDVLNGQKEIWVQVLEKAYAQANGGYSGISGGGSPVIALQELTGHAATWQSPASLTLTALTQDIAAHDLIVMDTSSSSNLPYNLVSGHAYMFEALKTVSGTSYVQLGNPWGMDQPALIPLSQLSKGIAEVDIGHYT